jgi:plastocyanin
MKKQRAAFSGLFAPFLLAGVLAAALMCLTGFSVWMASSGWNMRGHMGRMMGGGSNTCESPIVVGDVSTTVEIRDYAYSPGNLQVPVGATVTWTNDDGAQHTATAKSRDWDTGKLGQGESGAITFRVAGTYTYYCTIHPSMVARVVVR